jgi:osmotically-inducible protein OsmY
MSGRGNGQKRRRASVGAGRAMRQDDDVKQDVEAELLGDPSFDAADIAVNVKDGVVSLTGFVRFYRHRNAAVAAAKRVAGVAGVVDDIEVRLPLLHQRPDPLIARDAVQAFRRDLPETADTIQAIVHNGWVTLEGEVEWNYQREEAKRAVDRLRGVIGVSNLIRLKQVAAPADIRDAIAEAFRRNAMIDASRIRIEVNDREVALSGTVQSWAEREEAERAAWTTPGVTKVDNRIVVEQASS